MLMWQECKSTAFNEIKRENEEKRGERGGKITFSSNHDGSLLRRHPGAGLQSLQLCSLQKPTRDAQVGYTQ